jgi:hypothetical protein
MFQFSYGLFKSHGLRSCMVCNHLKQNQIWDDLKKKNLKVTIYMCKRKTHTPFGRGQCDQKAIIWTILVEVYKTMACANYLCTRSFGSREVDLFKFLYSIPFGCQGNKISAWNQNSFDNFGIPLHKKQSWQVKLKSDFLRRFF